MIIVLVGPSAVGKDTLQNYLIDEYGLERLVSCTTRPPRPNEINGKEYWFWNESKYIKEAADLKFAATRTYFTKVQGVSEVWFYGLHEDHIGFENSITILDLAGYRQLKEKFGDDVIGIALHASEEVRKSRCVGRGDFDEDEWKRRAADDKIRFASSIRETQFCINMDQGIGFVKNVIDEIMEEVGLFPLHSRIADYSNCDHLLFKVDLPEGLAYVHEDGSLSSVTAEGMELLQRPNGELVLKPRIWGEENGA